MATSSFTKYYIKLTSDRSKVNKPAGLDEIFKSLFLLKISNRAQLMNQTAFFEVLTQPLKSTPQMNALSKT